MVGLERMSWSLDGWIIVAGILCSVSAALLGNFLVLRRLSMLGDAISHAILPGLAAAFFISGSRNSIPMFVGAVLVGVLTALFTEWIRRHGNVDEGASMGVVFTSMFALGLVMIVQAADHVDLDPGCVLYGAIELTPLDQWTIAGYSVPRVVVILSIVTLINLGFVVLFFKELRISSFDPALSTTSGIHAGVMHYLLMILVAVTAVASFESVGNILVVAMFVVPPSAALMLTERLSVMVFLSTGLAVVSAVLGHLGALVVPRWFGFRSTTTAGMMAVAAGLLFSGCVLFAPRHGVLVKWIRRRALSWRIVSEDILAFLFRMEESSASRCETKAAMRNFLLSGAFETTLAVWLHRFQHRIRPFDDGYQLTDQGRQLAQRLVRSHRLWEQYLVDHVGLSDDRIHDKAERLEHFTDRELRDRLEEETMSPEIDPHGRPIPSERIDEK